MSRELEQLKAEIKRARAYAKAFWRSREFIAAALAAGDDITMGAVNLALVREGKFPTGYVVEFPDTDVCYLYTTVFGRKMSPPTIYRLAFVGDRASKWKAKNPMYGDVPIPDDWQLGDGVKVFGGQ